MATQYHRNIYASTATANSMSTSTGMTSPMSNILKPKGQTLDIQMELQILLRENEKLASIARLCIHLVDRCRSLNKSKQFVEDISRLGNLIDDFNQSNTKKDSQLPTFSNTGLVLTNQDNSSTIITNTTNGHHKNINASMSSMIQNNAGRNQNNMYLIPVGHNPQGQQQFQLIQTNEMTMALMASSKGKTKGRKPSLMVMNEMVQPNDQQQSILFKKLTGTSQLLDSSMILQQEQQQQMNETRNGITIPANLSGDSSSSLFSIVQENNQNLVDHSNIENNPNIKLQVGNQNNTNQNNSNNNINPTNRSSNNNNNSTDNNQHKIFKCHICDKVFVNAYNLNRHIKSHSGYQPFVCIYPTCSKRFNYNYHLKRHMETHTGARPFVCTWPDCDQRFNRKFNLNRHLWIHAENKKNSTNSAVT